MILSPTHRLARMFLCALTLTGGPLAVTAFALDFAVLTGSVEPERAARYAVFRDFQIKGVCASQRLDLASAWGANTLRTYVPPSRADLDEYQRLGLKVIVGIWMPHHGENRGQDGKWNYDYTAQGDKQVPEFAAVVDRIGDHPAILLWCLGNEVHLDAPYLETVNRMSRLLHEKHPRQLTSLTLINAPKDKLALIKQLAPDLDMLGFNSYGQGAVNGSSRNLEEVWGRAYYVSEFGPQGPWGGRQTPWGVTYEQSYDVKVDDLRKSLARIDQAPHCLGSTMFLWGVFQRGKEFATYFSAFLPPQIDDRAVPEKDLYVTPLAEEFRRYWSGRYPDKRSPILTTIRIAGLADDAHAKVPAGKPFRVTATATDPNQSGRPLRYRWWVVDFEGKIQAGPLDTTEPEVEFPALSIGSQKGYFVLAYVVAEDAQASGFSRPFQVE